MPIDQNVLAASTIAGPLFRVAAMSTSRDEEGNWMCHNFIGMQSAPGGASPTFVVAHVAHNGADDESVDFDRKRHGVLSLPYACAKLYTSPFVSSRT